MSTLRPALSLWLVFKQKGRDRIRCGKLCRSINLRRGGIRVAFRTAFFAFPNEPPELKGPIMAANELIKNNDNVRIISWPQLSIFGASIPDEVKGGIEKVDVLLCDITRPNLNVYYEIGYCVGLGKSLAPVLNVSFANAPTDIHKDGLFDVIGYGSYENSGALAGLMGDLPSRVLWICTASR
jgi:hypothetical protein